MDSLHSYIKDQTWWSFNAPPNASWIVKQNCKVKSALRMVNMQTWQQDTKYSISNVYKLLITQVDEVNWVHGVWHRMTLPKHRVISWLGV